MHIFKNLDIIVQVSGRYVSTAQRNLSENKFLIYISFLLDKISNYDYNVIRAGMAEWQTRMVQVHVIAIS